MGFFKFLPLVFISLLLFSSAVFASSTQQYNKIFLNPFYRESMTSATNYTYNITVNPPDNIASVTSAIFSFNAQINGQTQSFTLYVNGKYCNNRNYTVATAFSTTGNIQFYFDCSNVIKTSGTYNVTLRSTVNTGAIIGWLDLTYMNNPSSIGTGGTEYMTNENARIFARLLDGNSRPINLASCNATIYFPNNTKFLNNQPLTLLERGVYYYDFVTPNITGNYITIFDCVTPSIPFYQNYTLQGIVLQAGESDQYYEIDFGFDNTNNVTINSALLEVKVTGSIAGSIIGVDFNSRRLGTLTGITPALGNYTLTQSDFYLTDTQVLILTREGTGVNTLYWARLVVNYTWNNPQQMIRGQDEVHIGQIGVSVANITTNLNSIPANVWNYPVRNLTYYPNATADVNYTYFNQQFNNTNNFISNTNSSLSSMISNIPSLVWNFTSRTLTSFNFLVNITQEALNNIANAVWNYPVRNLTYYPPTVNTTNITTILNITNVTTVLNVTNTTLNITNVTSIFNITNQTVNVTNYTLNLTNQTLNVTVLNQTVNTTNYTLNTTEYLLNLTNYTINITNTTVEPIFNITNYTINVTNQTINITNVTTVINITNVTTITDFTNVTNAISSVNQTVLSEHNATNNLINYWGTLNENTTNYWGNSIWNFLQNITFGGNVTANVDYDKIAMYTLTYLKGAKFWCWFIDCGEDTSILFSQNTKVK